MDQDRVQENRRRDAESLTIKGTFFAVLSVPVLIGTIWAKTTEAMITNVGAGLCLLGVGALFLYRGRRIRAQFDR